MAIKYGGKTTPDYSAMRGPCDEGFHVPLNTEWQAVKDIWTALGGGSSDGTNFGIALKLPFAGYRSYLSADVGSQGGYGNYWSSSRNDTNSAYRLYFNSTALNPQSSVSRVYGSSVRCFKDTPTIPTSSWTKLYGTSIEAGGIFWSSADGLISLSSDGTNWITIADKNLGATTVWNSGDTLSEANCGYYYQRGNNYGFPFTGSVTTSSTQVDASNYGPGNYYSSSTFITRSGSPYRWDTTDNGNLWGGDTGIIQRPVDLAERYYGGKLVDDYSAMRGPCDEGFHIMSSDEFFLFRNMGKSIGAISANDDANNVRKYMKIPPSSYMKGTSGEITHPSATNGYGWLRFCKTNTESQAPRLQLGYGVIVSVPNNNRSNACSIRAVKDVPVVPDSSWTMTYDGSSIAAGAGIYWNSTLGLISISADGNTWMTIADKNLGATTAYNESMTLNEIKTDAVCGLIYQRGNCQGVSAFGTISTSSTQVDASAYGPNNYYLSGTFITGSQDWSSVRNDNLRGGVTGMIQKPVKVIEVYYGSTKIWPSYPAGIYWNPNIDGGVISISSNGVDWLTLSDKNLGATTVYNLGDTMSEANCGKFYQRGNNYGFSYTGTPSRSSTKVDVSSYGPNNYYSNSTFRRVSYSGNWRTDGSTTAAFNLWGGVTGTVEAMQGPCSNGFHIPSRSDITNLVSMYIGLDILSDTDSQAYLKIPRMGIRDNYNATVNDAGTDGGFRSCTINTEPYESTYYPYACECWNQSQHQIQLSTGHMNSYCLGIRPFKNEAIMPDDTRIPILN